MSQQGGRSTGHEDDWWGRLYGDSTGDTGPTPAADSLDDRFASAAGAVNERSGSAAGTVGGPPVSAAGAAQEPTAGPPFASEPGAVIPTQRAGGADEPDAPHPTDRAPQRAPWEPPPATPTGPVTFPPGQRPPGPGYAERAPGGRTTSAGGARNSTHGPVPRVPASRTPPDPPPTPSPPSAPPPTRDTPEPHLTSAAPAPPDSPAALSSPSASAEFTDAPPAGTPTDAVPPRGTSAGNLPTDKPAAAPARTTSASGVAAIPPAAAADSLPEPPEPPGPPDLRGDPRAPSAGQDAAVPPAAPGARSGTVLGRSVPPPRVYVGSRPPTYDAEPTALPPADPDDLDDLVADTVLDGARYGACTLRAASLRGDSARYRGEPRRDALLTARFGSGEQALVLVAMATGARATPAAHRAAAEACHWIGRAVGRSHPRLVEDLRAARRGDLKSGLHRLTDRSLGKLRATAVEQGLEPEEYSATLRCLLLPADPDCRTRVFFGVGAGGLFRLRDGEWQDIEPHVADVTGEPVVGFGSLPTETPEGDRLTMDLGIPTPPSPYEPAPEPPREPFRFRTSVARPGDTLLMCTGGLADPLRGEPELCAYLTERWSGPEPPGLAAFLADTQVRVKGYADDRTAAAVWEA